MRPLALLTPALALAALAAVARPAAADPTAFAAPIHRSPPPDAPPVLPGQPPPEASPSDAVPVLPPSDAEPGPPPAEGRFPPGARRPPFAAPPPEEALSPGAMPYWRRRPADLPAGPADAPEAPPRARRPQHVLGVEAGVRVLDVSSAGFGAFSSSSLLPSASVGVSVPLVQRGRLTLAVFGEYDLGLAESTARGDASSLVLHRAAAGLEPRLHLGSRLDLFARLAGGALYLDASLDDRSASQSLVSRTWTWSLDATGGVSVLLTRAGSSAPPVAGLWLTADVGYAFAGSSDLRFAPQASSDDPRVWGTVSLPSLRPGGAVNHWGLAYRF